MTTALLLEDCLEAVPETTLTDKVEFMTKKKWDEHKERGREASLLFSEMLFEDPPEKMIIIVNRKFPQVKPSGVHGFGLFAERDYESGDFVTNYGGIEITPELLQEVPQVNTSDYKVLTPSGRKWDGTAVSNPLRERARWVNDFRGTGQIGPNCIFLENCFGGVFVATILPVSCGQEFLIDYGNSYWESPERQALLKHQKPNE